ncbi:hypothetical protein Ptr902_05987 [Pyrenophora tritici-repentis]|nr:hypothetical protein Ptr902_05987 [Pyrenophora tritici-repentis]
MAYGNPPGYPGSPPDHNRRGYSPSNDNRRRGHEHHRRDHSAQSDEYRIDSSPRRRGRTPTQHSAHSDEDPSGPIEKTVEELEALMARAKAEMEAANDELQRCQRIRAKADAKRSANFKAENPSSPTLSSVTTEKDDTPKVGQGKNPKYPSLPHAPKPEMTRYAPLVVNTPLGRAAASTNSQGSSNAPLTKKQRFAVMRNSLQRLLEMEFDPTAARYHPLGFGGGWGEDCVYPWKYGAGKNDQLGLCKPMYLHEGCSK